MNLKQAIKEIDVMQDAMLQGGLRVPALMLVLAAARAYACETCGGNGGWAEMNDDKMEEIDCPACADSRKILEDAE